MHPRVDDAPLRLAVIGCGRVIERYHVPALRRTPEWNVVGACDPLRVRLDWIRTQFDHASVFATLDDLADGCGADAALVATPPCTHREVVVRALESGLHVLVEKPMALSATEAEAMWQASLRTRNYLAVGFSRRFKRCYAELRQRLAGLGPGEIRRVRFDLVGNAAAWRPVTGFIGSDERGGGVLDDMASHQLDLLPWLLRRRVSRIRVRGEERSQQADTIAYEVEFDDGVTAVCTAGHGMPKDETLRVELRDHQLIVSADRLLTLRFRSAAAARAHCRVRRLADRLLRRHGQTDDDVTVFARQLHAFATLVRSNGATDVADASSGVSTVRCVEACRDSIRSRGGWIAVERVRTTGSGEM